jgi:hypothetical protein
MPMNGLKVSYPSYETHCLLIDQSTISIVLETISRRSWDLWRGPGRGRRWKGSSAMESATVKRVGNPPPPLSYPLTGSIISTIFQKSSNK